MKLIDNSWRTHKINHEREGVCIPRYRILLIFINFNFDFLALYKLYFQNYFANRSIKLESFTSHLQYLHPCCIRYTTLAFGSCCLCWYNTAAHVVNSTNIHRMILNKRNDTIPSWSSSNGSEYATANSSASKKWVLILFSSQLVSVFNWYPRLSSHYFYTRFLC